MNALPDIHDLSAGSQIPAPGLAQPVFFDGLAGMYHAASGSTAVLFVPPWSYEELCARTTYRLVAERLAALGYPCLRFDLPGTCHSAGVSGEIGDDAAWRTATRHAVEYLDTLCKPREIVVIGQGIGGLLAGQLAQERTVDGLVLLAPVAQGRAYLREVAAWTAMTQREFRVASTDGPEGGLMSAGFVLSSATVNEIKRLKLAEAPSQARRVLLASRPDNGSDARLAADLSAAGVPLETIPFDDYAAYVSSSIFAAVPERTVERVVDWLTRHFPPEPAAGLLAGAIPQPAVLEADGFRERLFRFGPDGLFFGALTTPADRAADTALLVLNTGKDHSSGWGRSAVDLARDMAREGFAVLRMDLAGIGETPLPPGQEAPVLYSAGASGDVDCAIEWLLSNAGVGKVVLVGRCSGAYASLLSAASDERVAGAFLVNARTLHWDTDLDVYAVMREPAEPLAVYRQNLKSSRQLKRLLSGELRISTIVRKLSRTFAAIAERKLAHVLRSRSKHYRFGRIVQGRLKALKDRNVAVALVYSQGDPGLFDLYNWLGPNARRLPAYPNLHLSVIDDADHNFTPLPLRAKVTQALLEFTRRVQAG